MLINADLSQPVSLNIDDVPWVPSPMPGVERRMLYRDGGEVAKATSLVRYAPNSYFSPHTHGGGEEFFVLEGTFSDEHDHYPAGTYVRNPVGSRHKPYSKDGCIILVRLWQMDPEDQEYVRIYTPEADWQATETEGLEKLPLHRFGGEEVFMLRNLGTLETAIGQNYRNIELLQMEVTNENSGLTFLSKKWFRGSGRYRFRERQYTLSQYLLSVRKTKVSI